MYGKQTPEWVLLSLVLAPFAHNRGTQLHGRSEPAKPLARCRETSLSSPLAWRLDNLISAAEHVNLQSMSECGRPKLQGIAKADARDATLA